MIVVAHAPLASALLAVVAHVHGSLPAGIVAVDVPADEPRQTTTDTIASLIKQTGSNTLVLTDLPGATPHNSAASACTIGAHATPIVCPVNAAMLLRAVNYRHLCAADLAVKLAQ